MVRKSRIALGVAIVLGTASAATAAVKHHPVRHHRVAVESANSYGSVNAGTMSNGAEPDYIAIQSEDFHQQY
jgi:hypothetical protein